MSTDWSKAYNKQRTWEKDKTLVNGDNGTKLCMCCEKRKYTTDFPDVDEFVDHKLPVCLECFRRNSGDGLEVVALYEGVERQCKKCKRPLTLDNYAYRKTGNKLHDTCRDCVGTFDREEVYGG